MLRANGFQAMQKDLNNKKKSLKVNALNIKGKRNKTKNIK